MSRRTTRRPQRRTPVPNTSPSTPAAIVATVRAIQDDAHRLAEADWGNLDEATGSELELIRRHVHSLRKILERLAAR